MKYIKVNQHTTTADLQRQYREWSKKLHPDAGGSDAEFQQLNVEYQQAQKYLQTGNINFISKDEIIRVLKTTAQHHLRNALTGFLTDIAENIKKNM